VDVVEDQSEQEKEQISPKEDEDEESDHSGSNENDNEIKHMKPEEDELDFTEVKIASKYAAFTKKSSKDGQIYIHFST